jgi:biopolymer transport protein ExbD
VNLRPRRRDEPEIMLIPLIDILLMLLIFFMLTTSFQRESQIEIVLPKASVEAPPAEEFVMNITINKEGTFFINGQRVLNSQLETLKKAMQEVAGERKDPPIILSADAQTPHQYVVTVMDASRQLGFVHLNFATTRTSEAQ